MSVRPRGRRALLASFLAAVAAVAVVAVAFSSDRSTPPPFAPTSPFNTALATDVRPVPGSDAVAATLVAGAPGVADLYAYGVPVYEARSSTPRRRVVCTEPWGTCELTGLGVPIPGGARPSGGSDAAMVVLDRPARRAYEFFRARALPDGDWTTGWGSVVDLSGDGRRGETGSGLSLLGGVVQTQEMQSGEIRHALVFSTSAACRDRFVVPATKTDGQSTRPGCVPEGTRIQLDPAVDVDALPGATPAERTIARALQRYGAYARDSGGATMAFIFETPTAGRDPYPGVGLAYDYFAMAHIPWAGLRVVPAPGAP